MILKFHIQNKSIGLHPTEDGLLLVEMPPQKRTVLTETNKGYHTLDFPYILFTIRYIKRNGKFVYPGIYGCGLKVHGCNHSLKTIKEEILTLSVENDRRGLSCTNHDDDGKSFDSLKELVNYIISSWWNHRHKYNNDKHASYKSYKLAISYDSSNS